MRGAWSGWQGSDDVYPTASVSKTVPPIRWTVLIRKIWISCYRNEERNFNFLVDFLVFTWRRVLNAIIFGVRRKNYNSAYSGCATRGYAKCCKASVTNDPRLHCMFHRTKSLSLPLSRVAGPNLQHPTPQL